MLRVCARQWDAVEITPTKPLQQQSNRSLCRILYQSFINIHFHSNYAINRVNKPQSTLIVFYYYCTQFLCFQLWQKDNSWRKCPDVSVPNLFKGIATLLLAVASVCHVFFYRVTLRDESQCLLYGGINTHTGQYELLCFSFAELPHARVCKYWTLFQRSAEKELTPLKHICCTLRREMCNVRGLSALNGPTQSWQQHCHGILCDLKWMYSSVTSGLQGCCSGCFFFPPGLHFSGQETKKNITHYRSQWETHKKVFYESKMCHRFVHLVCSVVEHGGMSVRLSPRLRVISLTKHFIVLYWVGKKK